VATSVILPQLGAIHVLTTAGNLLASKLENLARKKKPPLGVWMECLLFLQAMPVIWFIGLPFLQGLLLISYSGHSVSSFRLQFNSTAILRDNPKTKTFFLLKYIGAFVSDINGMILDCSSF
jgi:hypothetical protein